MKLIAILSVFSVFFTPLIHGQSLVKPNIVIFYADDLGWQDTQLNDEGTPVPWETPNMLSLAADGAKFSQAYSPAPTCAPSRSAMMSGLHPTQTKMTHVAGGKLPAVNSNNNANSIIHPFYPGRLGVEKITIAEALGEAGYVSGHIGKWHMAAKHNLFPEAIDQGFTMHSTGRGIAQSMDRWDQSDWGTGVGEPYELDADGRPYDSVTEDALTFLEDNKATPFFLYMATWLVHTPIQSRDLIRLQYYFNKINGKPTDGSDDFPLPTVDADITAQGQANPYYGAMVASLDWSLGRIVDYLKATDDPRNVGKKLFETTYVIFSSDNGGSETHGGEIITDNYPLDQGKKHAQEGGIRTPLVITGPDVVVAEYDNVVSHLDFYPTILSLTGTTADVSVTDELFGVDLTDLLEGTSTVVLDKNNTERTDLFWHYPHGTDDAMQSALRSGEYKLYKNHLDNSYELYQLYSTVDGSNVDIEEAIDIIDTVDGTLKNELIGKLETFLTTYNARIPQRNAAYTGSGSPLTNQNNVPTVGTPTYDQNTRIATATVSATPGQAGISKAYILYSVIGDDQKELFETDATINGSVITATVPVDAAAINFELIDDNNFLILSEEIPTIEIDYLEINDTDTVQVFNSGDEYSELLGDAVDKGTYLQMREVGGGANFLVKTNQSVSVDKITIEVKTLQGDVTDFDVTIGSVSQGLHYTAPDTGFEEIDFDNGGSSFVLDAGVHNMNIEVSAIAGLAGANPRFRIYEITFHISQFLSTDNPITGNGNVFEAYPNPVKKTFSLTQEVESGTLYNMSGKKVHQFSNEFENIDISKLGSGIYLLDVVKENGTQQSMKIIKE